MNQVAKPLASSAGHVVPSTLPLTENKPVSGESLFERFAWIYIFCRERVFRDDTDRIIRRLWGNRRPAAGSQVLELGCGPGFYSRTLATRFPETSVIGIDCCTRQLEYARQKATRLGLGNCDFQSGNVLDLNQPDDSFDAVIASRLFTVLPKRERAVGEIFRILRPGGRCFIAEPRYAFSAWIPLLIMRLLARVNGYGGEYREPARPTVLPADQFRSLFQTQPWKRVEFWRAGRYQYALCEKP